MNEFFPTKGEMLLRGQQLLADFCRLNSLPEPQVELVDAKDWQFDVCAYYRKDIIKICLRKCAEIGFAGMSWSYPGNTVDRTPYGVLQHELGHHVDLISSTRRGAYFGDFSIGMRQRSGEEPITTYCPNDAEWFAEMFRVFVTNPDLLLRLRPRTHAEMLARFKPVFSDTWEQRMVGAPERTIVSIQRKLEPKRPARRKAAA